MRVRLEGVINALKLLYVFYDVGCRPSVYHDDALHCHINWWCLIAFLFGLEQVVRLASVLSSAIFLAPSCPPFFLHGDSWCVLLLQ